MGTVYSVQKTKWDQNIPSEAIKPIELSGRVRVAYGSYTASAEQSDIHMFNLPNGARMLSGEVMHVAMGGSTTISVGNAAYTNAAGTVVALDVDSYKAAAASTGVATTDMLATAALGRNTVVDADGTGLPVTVSLAGGNGTGLIQLKVLYVLD